MIEPIRQSFLYRGNVVFLTDRGTWRFWMAGEDDPRWEKLALRYRAPWETEAKRIIDMDPK